MGVGQHQQASRSKRGIKRAVVHKRLVTSQQDLPQNLHPIPSLCVSWERWGCLRTCSSNSIRAGLSVSPGMPCRQGLIGLGERRGCWHSLQCTGRCAPTIAGGHEGAQICHENDGNWGAEQCRWVSKTTTCTWNHGNEEIFTTFQNILCHWSRILGLHSSGSVGSSVSSWWFWRSMCSLHWDTLSLAMIQQKDVQLSWSFIVNNLWQLKRWPWVWFIGWSPLCNMPGNGPVELSFVTQIRSTSSISARENVASSSELIAYVIHWSGRATNAFQIMSFMPNTRKARWQLVGLSGGDVGLRSFHLGFCSVLIKIYIGNPYTVRKISYCSFRWFSSFLLWVSFLR